MSTSSTTAGEENLFSPCPDEALPAKYQVDARVAYGDLPGVNTITTSRKRVLIYVNGMNVDPPGHVGDAKALATIAGQDVTGIYNITGSDGVKGGANFRHDILRCTKEVALMTGRTRYASPSYWRAKATQDRNQLFGADDAKMDQINLEIAMDILSSNQAAITLFKVLQKLRRQLTDAVIICHSEGNLITSNTLWVMRSLYEPGAVGNVNVLGLASPAISWPHNNGSGIRFELFRDPRDPITLVSFPSIGTKPSTAKNAGVVDSSFGDRVASYFKLRFGSHDCIAYLVRPDFQAALKLAIE